MSSELKNGAYDANSSMKIRQFKRFPCLICGVTNSNLSFHKFPVNKAVRLEWASFCGIDAEKIKNWQGLCDSHFVKDDFFSNVSYTTTRKFLKRNRVPSQKPPKLSKESPLEKYCLEIMLDSSDCIENVDEDCVTKCVDTIIENELHNLSASNTRTIFSTTSVNENVTQASLTFPHKFPRYFMDIKSEDVSSPRYAKHCLEMGKETILKCRRKIDVLQRQNKILQKKLLSSQEVFLRLKNNSISMDEAVRIIDRRNIFRFGNKACVL